MISKWILFPTRTAMAGGLAMAVLAMAGLGSGCAADLAETGAAAGAGDLLERDNTLPSDLVPGSLAEAPAGCEGRIPSLDAVSFHLASAEFGLVAALNDGGEVVCVDTVEAVQSELAASGYEDEAEDLGYRFERTAIELALAGWDTGDPSPQPSVEEVDSIRQRLTARSASEGIENGDPSPQPSNQPAGAPAH